MAIDASYNIPSVDNMSNVSGWQGLANKFTGNVDFARDVTLNNYNNAFNSAEAAKARNWEAEQAAIARNFNSAEAAKQREFEKSLSDTQYSRAAADLRSLGLNPAMVLGGASASTPSGASASIGTPSASAAHSSGASRGKGSGEGWTGLLNFLGTLAIAAGGIAKTAMSSATAASNNALRVDAMNHATDVHSALNSSTILKNTRFAEKAAAQTEQIRNKTFFKELAATRKQRSADLLNAISRGVQNGYKFK